MKNIIKVFLLLFMMLGFISLESTAGGCIYQGASGTTYVCVSHPFYYCSFPLENGGTAFCNYAQGPIINNPPSRGVPA